MDLSEIIQLKKEHLNRLANQTGSEGEISVIEDLEALTRRPKGQQLKNLLAALKRTGIEIKGTSFDAIELPQNCNLNLDDIESIEHLINDITFIEIKTANQERVKPDFSGFFFALTESEIAAAEQLGKRHKVILYNKKTAATLVTSIPEIIKRRKSATWQISVQL